MNAEKKTKRERLEDALKQHDLTENQYRMIVILKYIPGLNREEIDAQFLKYQDVPSEDLSDVLKKDHPLQ